MALHRISIDLDSQGEARALTERLIDFVDPPPSATSFYEVPDTRRWRVDAYVDAEPGAELLLIIAGLAPGRNLTVEPVPDVNWVALSQAALPPVNAGAFIVHGSHDRLRVGRRLNAIEIDAGEAFGTAHHSSTEGCLQAIDLLTRRRSFKRVLDLGCGSGVLAIATAQRLPKAQIIASDIDPIAVAVARANTRFNRVSKRIGTLTAIGMAHPRLRGDQRFDLVIANILAGPLIGLAPTLARSIEASGIVVLSGLLIEQAREVLAVYLAAGFRLHKRHVLAGWATLVLQRSA